MAGSFFIKKNFIIGKVTAAPFKTVATFSNMFYDGICGPTPQSDFFWLPIPAVKQPTK